jgi:hypothetical protein
MVCYDLVWYGKRNAMVWWGEVGCGAAWCDEVCCRVVWFLYGVVMLRYGTAWHITARNGSVR